MSNLGQKYTEYLAEKFDTHVLETEHAFITYQFRGENAVWIDILHVDSEHRREGEGTKIWEVFKEKMPSHVTVCIAEIDIMSHNPETALVAFIKRGFKVLSLEGSKINIYNKFRESEK